GAHTESSGDPEECGRATADSSAVLLDVESVDRERTAGDAGRTWCRLHCVFPAGARATQQQVSERRTGQLEGGCGWFAAQGVLERRKFEVCAGAERDRPGSWTVVGTDGHCL